MNLKNIDHGWLYVIAGLILTITAIVLPAMDELSVLQVKQQAIAQSRDQLQLRKDAYLGFLDQLTSDDPTIHTRMRDMQFNVEPEGVPVVIDTAASHTPLQWIEHKAVTFQPVPSLASDQSLLTSLTSDTRRLWMAGFGITIIFLGIVLTPVHSHT